MHYFSKLRWNIIPYFSGAQSRTNRRGSSTSGTLRPAYLTSFFPKNTKCIFLENWYFGIRKDKYCQSQSLLDRTHSIGVEMGKSMRGERGKGKRNRMSEAAEDPPSKFNLKSSIIIENFKFFMMFFFQIHEGVFVGWINYYNRTENERTRRCFQISVHFFSAIYSRCSSMISLPQRYFAFYSDSISDNKIVKFSVG